MLNEKDLNKIIVVKGQIIKGNEFYTDNSIFCELLFYLDKNSKIISNNQNIVTTSCYLNDNKELFWDTPFIFENIIDIVNYKLVGSIRVWELETNGTHKKIAYGNFFVPNEEGYHEIWVNTWTPKGNNKMDKMSFYLNQEPILIEEEIITNENNNRKLLSTYSNGKIKIDLDIKFNNY